MSAPTPSAPPMDWEDWRDGFSEKVWDESRRNSDSAKSEPKKTQRERRKNFYPKSPPKKVEPKARPRQPCSIYFDKLGYQEHEGDTLHLYRHKKNKLRVVLAPKSSNNVCAMSVCFLVGSKAETLSTTGSAHILEHELFKGSENFSKANGKSIWSVLGNKGVRLNASTSKDRTEFNSTLPSVETLYKALEIEADRLRAPLLQGLKTEFVVVRNEYERGKNNTSSLLREMVFKTAFPMSSAGVPTIGSLEDICNVLKHADDLREFHRKYYCCANCIIVISGVFGDPTKLLAKIHSCFGGLPTGKCLRDVDPETGLDSAETEHDPPQRGMRCVDLAGEMPLVLLGYRSPPSGVCREAIALEVLSEWMSAGTNGMFATLLKNDRELHAVEIDYERGYGKSLFNVWIVTVSGGDTAGRCQRLSSKIMTILQEKYCTSDFCMSETQLQEMKANLKRRWTQERQKSCTSYTSAIVESLSRCNSPFDVFEQFLVLETITLKDISTVARDIFVPWRVTVGRVLPELLQFPLKDPSCTPYKFGGHASTDVPCTPAQRHVLPYDKAKLGEGSVYMLDPNADTVSLRLHIPALRSRSDIQTQLSAALATLGVELEDGTKLGEAGLRKKFESGGAVPTIVGNHTGITLALDIEADKDTTGIAALLHRALTHPYVLDEDFIRKREFLSTETVGSDYDVNSTAVKLFSQCLFHEHDDPRARLSGEQESALLVHTSKEEALQYLMEFAVRPAWVTCIAPDEATLTYIESLFQSAAQPVHDMTLKVPSVSPQANKIVLHPMEGKTSATMLLGCTTDITANDPRSLPLSLAVDALGGGFSSILMGEVRDKAGLTYGIYSNTSAVDPSTSTFATQATFAPSLLQKGVNMSRKLVKEWRENGITKQMLEDSKSRALGAVALASDSAVAVCNSLHAARLHFDNPAVRCASLPHRIQAVTLKQANEAVASLPPFNEFVCVAVGAIPKSSMQFE